MVGRRIGRGIASVAVVCVLASGCGGDDGASTSTAGDHTTKTQAASHHPARPSGPEPVASCTAGGSGWRSLRAGEGTSRVQAAVLGDERAAVVLANDSGNQACDWMPFTQALAERGFAVALFSYTRVGNPNDVAAVAQALRHRGATRVAAIGASAGGRAIVQLGALPKPDVDALISLSAEREVGPQYPNILPQAKQVHLPSLYIGSRKDGYTSFGKETVQLHEATPAETNEMLLVPGSDHGVDLVSGREAKRVRPAIFAFLEKLGFGEK
jgi:dienelactone hydrolase